jgi:plastocyanin
MRRLTSIIGIVAAVALIAACNGGDNGAAPDETAPGETGATAEITISGFVFSGADSVRVGDTVVITNADGVAHTWTEVDRAFDSGTLGTDETFEYTFDEAGVFDYFCTIHPEMTGTITVEA